MPVEITETAGGQAYTNPIVDEPKGMTHLKVDVSTLTTREVDGYGYIKPGVLFKNDGTIISGSGQTAYGVTVEAVKIPETTTNANLSSNTNDFLVAVSTNCLINRDIAEDNLESAYTANELAAIAAAGSRLQITTT